MFKENKIDINILLVYQTSGRLLLFTPKQVNLPTFQARCIRHLRLIPILLQPSPHHFAQKESLAKLGHDYRQFPFMKTMERLLRHHTSAHGLMTQKRQHHWRIQEIPRP
jgi:hypothetical protein